MVKQEKEEGALKTIGEASALLGVPSHVLRFWETKFPDVRPLKRKWRYYRPQDIKLLARIRDLLYKEKYSLEGAKEALKRSSSLRSLLDDLITLRQTLGGDHGP